MKTFTVNKNKQNQYKAPIMNYNRINIEAFEYLME